MLTDRCFTAGRRGSRRRTQSWTSPPATTTRSTTPSSGGAPPQRECPDRPPNCALIAGHVQTLENLSGHGASAGGPATAKASSKLSICRPSLMLDDSGLSHVVCRCGKVYGRHSNSLNVAKKCCGVCRGRLEPLGRFNADGTPAKTRGASAYSLFVKVRRVFNDREIECIWQCNCSRSAACSWAHCLSM